MRTFNRHWIILRMLIPLGRFAEASRRRFHSGSSQRRRQVLAVRLGKDIQYPRRLLDHDRSASIGSAQALGANVIQVQVRRAAVRRAQFALCHPYRDQRKVLERAG